MSEILDHVLAANARYAAEFGSKAELAAPPKRKFAILTCMDARIDPAKLAGFEEGDVHVIRNAGGRASDDALRSLIISYKLLDTREWFVIHHTECGLQNFSDENMRTLFSNSIQPEWGWHNSQTQAKTYQIDYINWLTIRSQPQTIIADVARIRNYPLVPPIIPIYGYMYDVKSGKLIEVPEATEIGAVKV